MSKRVFRDIVSLYTRGKRKGKLLLWSQRRHIQSLASEVSDVDVLYVQCKCIDNANLYSYLLVMGNKTFRLTDEDEKLMGQLSTATGLGPVGVLRLALRELAKTWAKKETPRKP